MFVWLLSDILHSLNVFIALSIKLFVFALYVVFAGRLFKARIPIALVDTLYIY